MFVASASELWLNSPNGVLNSIPPWPVGLIFPCLLSLILAILYGTEWTRMGNKAGTGSHVLFSVLCTIGDVIIMGFMTLFVYWTIGDITLGTFLDIWKLLYIAIPVTIGQFSLSSVLSHQIRRIKKIKQDIIAVKKKLKQELEELQRISESLSQKTVPDREKQVKYLEQSDGVGEAGQQ